MKAGGSRTAPEASTDNWHRLRRRSAYGSATLQPMRSNPSVRRGPFCNPIRGPVPAPFDSLWLGQQSTDGRTGLANPTALADAFPEIAKADMEEALAELEADGFVKLHHAFGPSLPRIQTTLDLFASFDLAATGHDPVRDSGALAQLALDGEAAVSAKALFEKTGWSHRRFNPALALVADQIPDGRVMRYSGAEFVVMGFHVLAADRVTLKRYLERVGGSD